MELGKLGVWYSFDHLSALEAAEAAIRIEKLGYSALWMPESRQRNPLVHASWLLANTDQLIIATGIANIYHRAPVAMIAAQMTLAEQSGGRFLLGMGVGHKPIVEGRGMDYGPPVATMRNYLHAMAAQAEASPYHLVHPSIQARRVIAALGPKMLELAREKCDGAHPYFTSPEHTAMAREILGPDKWLCVEQKVILETNPVKARELAWPVAQTYIDMTNYRNSWQRMGLKEDDLEHGGSQRFVDTTFAWGSVDRIKARIQEHFDAGASHVCIQPVSPNGQSGCVHWEALEALKP